MTRKQHTYKLIPSQNLGSSLVKNLIAKNEYDKLGQLITKEVGGSANNATDRWQEINYEYNIRGWLTNINDIRELMAGKGLPPPSPSDDLFSFAIQYNQLIEPGSGDYTSPLYNGNIAQTFWKTGSDNTLRGYNYDYDELNRLLNAEFYKKGTNPYSDAYKESLAYDLNGNITSLYRTTADAHNNAIQMDNLTYAYENGNGNSNLLKNVNDAVSNQNTGGFKDGNTNPALNDYEYDPNGNMTKDRNKGIESITYNHLNLPTKVTWSNEKYISYQYNAAGQKISKSVRENDSIIIVEYLDGFQYAGKVLQFFPHAEGYVKVTAISAGRGLPTSDFAFNYVFNYTDHLGNVRLSYSKDPQTGTLDIMDENHYYPFGLKHGVYTAATLKDFRIDEMGTNGGIGGGVGGVALINVTKTEYQYKYNGKEYQDELGLNMYDYGARNYDATIGRWMNVDPMAEKKPEWTPYRYAFNNPNFFTDPTGMFEDVIDINVNTGDITVTAAAGDDVVRLVNDDGSVVKDANGTEQSYTYGENGSFNKENTISQSDGQTRIASTNPQKAFNFFKFAAKSSVEFGFIRWTHNSGMQRATVLTNHSPNSVNGLVPYMRTILGNGSAQKISEYWHSHPNPLHSGVKNTHPSGFNEDGSISGYSGDRTTFESFNLDSSLKGRVPTNANIYSAHFNSRTTYNDKSFTVFPNYTGGSLMLNADFGQ